MRPFRWLARLWREMRFGAGPPAGGSPCLDPDRTCRYPSCPCGASWPPHDSTTNVSLP